MSNKTKISQMADRRSWQEKAESWREKIRVSAIINRLQDFAEGKKGVEMTAAQVKAAQTLLDRAMPTLSASEITRKDATVDPQALLDRLKAAVGEEAYAKLAKDYKPTDDDRNNATLQ